MWYQGIIIKVLEQFRRDKMFLPKVLVIVMMNSLLDPLGTFLSLDIRDGFNMISFSILTKLSILVLENCKICKIK